MRGGLVEPLQHHECRTFRTIRRRRERADREDPRAGALPISSACAAIAPATPVPWTCGPSLLPSAIEAFRDRTREFGMPDVDRGIDHRDGDVGAVASVWASGNRSLTSAYCAGSPSAGTAFLVLQQITEVRLHRSEHSLPAANSRPDGLDRSAVADAEQADGWRRQAENSATAGASARADAPARRPAHRSAAPSISATISFTREASAAACDPLRRGLLAVFLPDGPPLPPSAEVTG